MPRWNFGCAVIDAFTASLSFVLSLSLNNAMKLSFDAMLKAQPIEKEELASAWLYALTSLLFIMTLFFILLGCVKPLLRRNASLTCTHPWNWVVPLIGVVLIIAIVLPLSLIKDPPLAGEEQSMASGPST